MSHDDTEHAEQDEHADHADYAEQDDAEPGRPDAEREEIDAERARRLDPANRPDGAEVDNTDATLPTLEAWQAEQGDEPTPGRSDPSEVFREMEVSQEERDKIAAERERRLDPANRPDGAEVDNTGQSAGQDDAP